MSTDMSTATMGTETRTGMGTVVFACMDADTLGGIQRVTHTVAQGLATRGYTVHVVGLHRATDPIRYVERPAYEHHVISRLPLDRTGTASAMAQAAALAVVPMVNLERRRARRATARLLERTGPGYVVMTSPGVVTTLKGMLRPGQRSIGQYHGSYDHARGTWHHGSVKAHYGALDQAVFLSPDDAWRFSESALLPNTWDIPNPLFEWPASVSSLRAKRVLGVGRLAGVKRFDRLISAFAAARRTGWELHLIGDGPDEGRLRAHAIAEGVGDRVVFRGRIPAGRMSAEYLNAAVVGVSSEHEGLPLVLGEAASYGVPAVAFDVSGGVRTLVVHEETGLLAPPADVPALAASLGRLMDSADERRRLGAAARVNSERFRLEHVLDRWESLFTHISR